MISASIRRKRHRSSSPTVETTSSLPRHRPTRRCLSLAPSYIEVNSSSSPAQQTQESIDSAASFEVRAILDQRANQEGEVEYLVDWENSPQTGRAYSPSWEPIANIYAPEKVAEFNILHSTGASHGTLDEAIGARQFDKATSNNIRIQRRRRLIESDISDSPQQQLVIPESNHHSLESTSPSAPNNCSAAATRTDAPSRHEGFSRVSSPRLLLRRDHQNINISIPFLNNSSSPTSTHIAPPKSTPSRLLRENSPDLTPAPPVKSPRTIIPESQPYQPNFSNPSPSTHFIASTNSKVSCFICYTFFRHGF